MKKALLLALFFLTACSTTKKIAVNNNDILKDHTPPIKIFGIGHYTATSLILTLVDSKNQYFIVEEPYRDGLKIGAIYTP